MRVCAPTVERVMLQIEPCPERDENWNDGHNLIEGADGLHTYMRCRFCKKVWRKSTDPVGHLIAISFCAPTPDQLQK